MDLFKNPGMMQGMAAVGAVANRLVEMHNELCAIRAYLSPQHNVKVKRGTTATVGASVLPPPALPTLVVNPGAGTLAAANYTYRVTATNSNGETTPSAEPTVVAVALNGAVTINWVAVPGASGYKVYGRTASAELLIATLGNVVTYQDTGAVAPAGAMPVVNTAVVVGQDTAYASDDTLTVGWAGKRLDITLFDRNVYVQFDDGKGNWSDAQELIAPGFYSFPAVVTRVQVKTTDASPTPVQSRYQVAVWG